MNQNFKVNPNPSPLFGRDIKKPSFYKGLRQKTDTNLHKQLVNYIENLKNQKNTNIKILDWGGGEGALSQYLYDLGYKVTVVDMDEGSFKAKGPVFNKVNFNLQTEVDLFVKNNIGQFDIILAVEVIEHIQNPWFFISTLKDMCKIDTDIIITTPNISSWWGRFWFFVTGQLWSVSKEGWVDPGHINGLSDVEMRGIINDNGFNVINSFPGGNMPIIWAYNVKRFLISICILPFRLIQKGNLDGWVQCYHISLKKDK